MIPAREREIVADIMASAENLIGSVDDLWTHPSARRIHTTLGLVVLGLFELVAAGRAIGMSRLRTAVYGIAPRGSELYALDEVMQHLMTDPKARCFWDDLMPDKSYPHRCPRCSLAAFVGFNRVSCKKCGDY